MTTDSLDTQRRDAFAMWQSRAAAWDKWADQMHALAERLNQPLIEAADIAPGQQVLDLASGVGEPAFSLAERVGPAGQVTATDAVEEMVAALRRRAAGAGIGNLRVERADMEDLPFADRSFDAVTCRFGIMFTPRPERALAEARRVLRPGGAAVFMVWGPKDDTTLYRVVDPAVRDVLGEGLFDRSPFTPFRLGAAGQLRAAFEGGGFAEVEERELRFAPRIDAAVPFWRPNLEMSLGERYAALDEPTRRRLEEAIVAGFERYRIGDQIRLETHVRLGVGRG